MRIVGLGPGGFVSVSELDGEPFITVEPAGRAAEAREALSRPITVQMPVVPEGGELGDIGDGFVVLRPGEPGHVEAVLDTLPWIEEVVDLDAPTIEAEGEEVPGRVADETGAGGQA